jgi:DNA-binding IclR family transcriptional regulator
MSEWSFLTHHAQVLFCVAREPGVRLRDIADCVGITERAVHRIVCQLEEDGYLTRHRDGARNSYEIHPDLPLRGDLGGDVRVQDIFDVLLKEADREQEAAR